MKTLKEKIEAQCDNLQTRYVKVVELEGFTTNNARNYWERWKECADDLETLLRLETKYQ